MFSTLLYIAILAYQNVYSVSSDDYNARVMDINNLLFSKKYELGVNSIKKLQQNTLFTNDELENRLQLLSIKSNRISDNGISKIDYLSTDVHDLINVSILLSKNQKNEMAQSLLKTAIANKPNADSIIIYYELISSHNTLQSRIYKNSLNMRVSQWNANEALQLLDLMKKNEKLLL
ncbi:hypothetical protein U0R10_04045 [Aquirufa sp. OSTEICH-129V]|uniref:Tetratricopeptide repeat protein n=1 Tax=Aquirufa avitistagni TaxID=3104728 RepID=A0ABW6DE82_9BACT